MPGTRNTIEDLEWLKARGLAGAVQRHAQAGGMVVGVCGGYQMLGRTLRDPLHTESRLTQAEGLGLLDFDVTFREGKTTVQASGEIDCNGGWLRALNGLRVDGYEIHSGENAFGADCVPFLRLNGRDEADGVANRQGNVLGTYLHGIFDNGAFWRALVDRVREQKGLARGMGAPMTMAEYREREFDRLAGIVRQNLDMDAVYTILRGGDVPCGRWARA